MNPLCVRGPGPLTSARVETHKTPRASNGSILDPQQIGTWRGVPTPESSSGFMCASECCDILTRSAQEGDIEISPADLTRLTTIAGRKARRTHLPWIVSLKASLAILNSSAASQGKSALIMEVGCHLPTKPWNGTRWVRQGFASLRSITMSTLFHALYFVPRQWPSMPGSQAKRTAAMHCCASAIAHSKRSACILDAHVDGQ